MFGIVMKDVYDAISPGAGDAAPASGKAGQARLGSETAARRETCTARPTDRSAGLVHALWGTTRVLRSCPTG